MIAWVSDWIVNGKLRKLCLVGSGPNNFWKENNQFGCRNRMANGNQHIERKVIGQNIRKIRLSAGLSLRRLAALCRVDHADISKIERADVDPQLSTILELAQALRVPPHHFFNGHLPADHPLK